ncbi:hypothetical protein QQY66_32380 [Streptomyces sp. DG2A-72]|uniref:hypothetical protein n=1 Tax=Streptomyces sp. DG2A-72 TaxID=3051386 RepID=UPI00265B89DA|nr:hypothetical protein [Streptomyces sp. DG2A-72]MDO0936173.1 hypothetical protein [Streptomyces sp. DG2A-72]
MLPTPDALPLLAKGSGAASTSSGSSHTWANLLKADKEILQSTPSLRMDWEIRAGTTDRLQSA